MSLLFMPIWSYHCGPGHNFPGWDHSHSGPIGLYRPVLKAWAYNTGYGNERYWWGIITILEKIVKNRFWERLTIFFRPLHSMVERSNGMGCESVSVVHACRHAGIHASVDTLSEIFQQRFYPLSVGISSPNFQDILVA